MLYYTVSFHNVKSQDFKLSVSNPKSEYVAYVSVLSRISNCQGLGRKNKFEILKTDRTQCLLQVRHSRNVLLPRCSRGGFIITIMIVIIIIVIITTLSFQSFMFVFAA